MPRPHLRGRPPPSPPGCAPSSPGPGLGPRRALLVGMMGSGKTTVGRMVARRLGWPYLDSDEQVCRQTGRTVPQLFEERGEAAFRAAERAALARAATSVHPVVVSVAGGAVLDPDNRRRLRQAGTVVWLRARPETLARRVGTGEGRPLLGADPPSALRRLYARRRPLYADVADAVVDVDGLTPGEAAQRVVAMVRRAPCPDAQGSAPAGRHPR